jgi:hypothetical protein
MKHIVESVEEMYHAREPTGEVIIDAVVDAVRCTHTHRSEDIALLLDVDQRELWHSVHLLTGMRLNDIILHWRVLQAKEKWDANEALFQDYKESIKVKKQEVPEGFVMTKKMKDAYRYNVSTRCLDEIAKRYGWDSYRSLQRTAKRFGITFETLGYAVRKGK